MPLTSLCVPTWRHFSLVSIPFALRCYSFSLWTVLDLNPFCSLLFHLKPPLAPVLRFPSPHSLLGEGLGINFHLLSLSLTSTLVQVPGFHLLLLFTFIHSSHFRATCPKLAIFLPNLPASLFLLPLTPAPLPSQQPGMKSQHQPGSPFLLPIIFPQWPCRVTLTSARTWCTRMVKNSVLEPEVGFLNGCPEVIFNLSVPQCLHL